MRRWHFVMLFIVCLILILTIIGNLVTNNLMNNFRCMNDSIQTSNNLLLKKNQEMWDRDESRISKNLLLGIQLIKLHNLNKSFFLLADSVKTNIKRNDPSGQNIYIINTEMGNRNLAYRLQQKSDSIHFISFNLATDSNIKFLIKERLLLIKQIDHYRDNVKNRLVNLPSGAAITVLTKYQNNCLQAEQIILTTIGNRLPKETF